MSISYAEFASLTCPVCRASFAAEIWTIIDTGERPDLTEMLLSSTLNVVSCPQCGHQADAGGPLLVHDPDGKRVYFAAPADAPEHVWRERAQELLYVLVGSLPEEQRLPYLGDVQVEVEVSGVRRAMLRRGRHVAPRVSDAAEQTTRRSPAPPIDEIEPASLTTNPIVRGIEALLAADTPAEASALIDQHPEILTSDADALIEHLITAAHTQGERDIAGALMEVRALLYDLRAGTMPDTRRNDTHAAALPDPVVSAPGERCLAEQAYGAFLRADSPRALRETISTYPALLEPWVDDELAGRVEHALDEGNEHLAQAIELRRDMLTRLRTEMTGEKALHQAIRALLSAGSDADALVAVVGEYPALLTDVAQAALLELAAGARARGDDAMAQHAVECRALLRRVREGLQEE
ncbi:MAG: CpXC domain-containing protein [Roseiflexus sp.]